MNDRTNKEKRNRERNTKSIVRKEEKERSTLKQKMKVFVNEKEIVNMNNSDRVLMCY